MKVKELIELLKEQDQDIEVVMYTDHGHQLTSIERHGGSHRNEEYDEFVDEDLEELDEEEAYDLIKVFVLEG